jgi:hypothetical protein
MSQVASRAGIFRVRGGFLKHYTGSYDALCKSFQGKTIAWKRVCKRIFRTGGEKISFQQYRRKISLKIISVPAESVD